jgi:hypothetical protein
MASCIWGGGIGHGIRNLGPIHIKNPFKLSCLSLMADCSLRSGYHHSTELWHGVTPLVICTARCHRASGSTALICHVNVCLQTSRCWAAINKRIRVIFKVLRGTATTTIVDIPWLNLTIFSASTVPMLWFLIACSIFDPNSKNIPLSLPSNCLPFFRLEY